LILNENSRIPKNTYRPQPPFHHAIQQGVKKSLSVLTKLGIFPDFFGMTIFAISNIYQMALLFLLGPNPYYFSPQAACSMC